jgi:hypothetical protein
MRKIAVVAPIAILAVALAAPAFAQTATGVQLPPYAERGHREGSFAGYKEHHPFVSNFDDYLSQHPDEAKELNRNPTLIRDHKYLEKHPDLREYLKTHPRVASVYEHHPDQFMQRERHYEHREKEYEKHHPGTPANQ